MGHPRPVINRRRSVIFRRPLHLLRQITRPTGAVRRQHLRAERWSAEALSLRIALRPTSSWLLLLSPPLPPPPLRRLPLSAHHSLSRLELHLCLLPSVRYVLFALVLSHDVPTASRSACVHGSLGGRPVLRRRLPSSVGHTAGWRQIFPPIAGALHSHPAVDLEWVVAYIRARGRDGRTREKRARRLVCRRDALCGV